LNHIGNWSTPQFIIHNTLDYRLPESDGLQLFNILQAKGIPSRFLNFPDENHWVLGYENSLFWHQEIFNWINHYAKGEDLDTVPVGE
jgi:dipeptidyl aminopeptidase/acylaminoacyl peptidase